MADVVWLLEETILAIHQRQIAEHGGSGGLRDHGLLTSAVARPQQLMAYGQPSPDLPSLAAAYAYGIARNHPFVDGNKRTALVAARTFLLLNGVNVDQPKVSRLLRGQLSGFSADRLFAILNRLGHSVEVRISPKERAPEKSFTRVVIG